MTRVCAVVLTRDRKELLAACLDGLAAQTRPVDGLLVVDSASSDGTLEHIASYLNRPDWNALRLDENLGSAGGYGRGIKHAADAGYDWIWVMDDDAEPEREALAALLDAPVASDASTAALTSAVVLPSGEVDPLHAGHLKRWLVSLPASEYVSGTTPLLDFASYTGLFVRGAIARELDGPPLEFFTWADDVEYTLRVRDRGPIYLVPDSRVIHKAQMGGALQTRRSKLWNRLLGGDWTSAGWEDYWKQLYGIRNFVAIKQRRGGMSPLAFAGLTGAYVARSLMYDPQPLRRVKWIVRFARAGRRGDFSGPTPEEWRRIASGS